MLLLFLFACAPGTAQLQPDADSDGWTAALDCDDQDPGVNPGADEVCGNGVDDNCDLVAPGCGLFGELVLTDGQAISGEVAGGALGTVLVGGPVPAATAPGVGVLLLDEGRWVTSDSSSFGAALGTGEAGLLIGDPQAGTVVVVGLEERTLSGEREFGTAVAWADERVLVGAPGTAEDVGAVFLLDGEETVATVHGATTAGRLGEAVLSGDFDGDGVDDLVVAGLPEEKLPWAFLLLGPVSGEVSVADADASLTHWDSADAVALTGPCDVNGDGALDVVASFSEQMESDWGTWWNVGTLHVTGTSFDTVGGVYSANAQPLQPACGDADGDGLAEVAAAWTRSGWVVVDSGEWDNLAWLALPEDQPATVAFASGAQYDDLLLALPAGADGAGIVWRFPGGPGF